MNKKTNANKIPGPWEPRVITVNGFDFRVQPYCMNTLGFPEMIPRYLLTPNYAKTVAVHVDDPLLNPEQFIRDVLQGFHRELTDIILKHVAELSPRCRYLTYGGVPIIPTTQVPDNVILMHPSTYVLFQQINSCSPDIGFTDVQPSKSNTRPKEEEVGKT